MNGGRTWTAERDNVWLEIESTERMKSCFDRRTAIERARLKTTKTQQFRCWGLGRWRLGERNLGRERDGCRGNS